MFSSCIMAFKQQLQPTETSQTTTRKYFSQIYKSVEIPPITLINFNHLQLLIFFFSANKYYRCQCMEEELEKEHEISFCHKNTLTSKSLVYVYLDGIQVFDREIISSRHCSRFILEQYSSKKFTEKKVSISINQMISRMKYKQELKI